MGETSVGAERPQGKLGEAFDTSAKTASSLRSVLDRVASRLRGSQPSEIGTSSVSDNVSDQMSYTNDDLRTALTLAEEIENLL